MRLFIIVLVLLFSSYADATDWHKADQKTIAWDQPVALYDGAALPIGIQGWNYTVYTKNPGNGEITAVGTINAEQTTITVSEGQKVYIGVSAAYIDIDGIESDYSEIAWSDNPIDCLNGVTFGVHNLKRPDKSKNMRP